MVKVTETFLRCWQQILSYIPLGESQPLILPLFDLLERRERFHHVL